MKQCNSTLKGIGVGEVRISFDSLRYVSIHFPKSCAKWVNAFYCMSTNRLQTAIFVCR